MKSIMRIMGTSMDTITRLLIDAGEACLAFHDEQVRDLRLTQRVQVDEMWSFICCKEKTVPYAKKARRTQGTRGPGRRRTRTRSC